MKAGGHGFGRDRRLLHKKEFEAVLRHPQVRLGRGPLRLVAQGNAIRAPRLGLIVAKRVLRRAVDRNRAKRVIRESFRLQDSLPPMDIVVRVVEPRVGLSAADADRLFSALAGRAGPESSRDR